jgi:predicted transcriptional regulator
MKNVILNIDDDKVIPECITNFSSEENYLMMLIGSTYIVNGVSGIASIIHKEKLDGKVNEIQMLQNEIEIQKKYFKEEKENLEKNKKEEFENLVKIKIENKDLIIADLQKQIEVFPQICLKKRIMICLL